MILGAYGNNVITPGGAKSENLFGTNHVDVLYSYSNNDPSDMGEERHVVRF